MSTAMWSIIDRGDSASLAKSLEADPNLVYVRSEDGRGPLFWAYEYERYDMVKILLDKGEWIKLQLLLLLYQFMFNASALCLKVLMLQQWMHTETPLLVWWAKTSARPHGVMFRQEAMMSLRSMKNTKTMEKTSKY
jgi:ankyrin repeat protein